MSTLSKVFVVLVLVLSLVYLGVAATLFAHRTDWKDKFFKENEAHRRNLEAKDREIGKLVNEIKVHEDLQRALNDNIKQLEIEKAQINARYEEVRKDFNDLKGKYDILKAEQEKLVQQIGVQLTLNQELAKKVEEYRLKSTATVADRDTALQQLQYVRQDNEELKKNLAGLEQQHVKLARDQDTAQRQLAELARLGVDIEAYQKLPAKPLDGKVVAVSDKVNLVVISVGEDDGVQVGNKFTIFRGDKFVGQIVIEKAERDWSSGRIHDEIQADAVQIGDSVSNAIFSAGRN